MTKYVNSQSEQNKTIVCGFSYVECLQMSFSVTIFKLLVGLFFIVNSYLEALLPSSAILTNCIEIVQIHVVIIMMFIQSFGRLFQCFICVVLVAVVKEVLLKVLYMSNQCI